MAAVPGQRPLLWRLEGLGVGMGGDISTPKGCAKASHRLIASSRHREGIGVVFRATAFDQGEHTA